MFLYNYSTYALRESLVIVALGDIYQFVHIRRHLIIMSDEYKRHYVAFTPSDIS